jgi:amino acid adenylation domain-containing protein
MSNKSLAESVPAHFEAQVAGSSDAWAVRALDQSLRYRQLNAAANRVARCVLATASGTQSVAVLMGQGAPMIVAMLGVLKAGKMFVPLDPRQPPARMRQIREDCEAQVLVTDTSKLADARALIGSGVTLINIDTLDASLPADNLGLPIEGETLACLIYTSGSTGSPKGVVQTHRSLLNRAKAFADVLRVGPEDRLSLLANCSVAQGVSGTLQALVNGASIHPFDLRTLGIGELASWLAAHEITVLTCAPSAFRHFAKTLSIKDHFPALRVIRLGSEQVLPQDFELYQRHFHRGCAFVGTLGSTEAGPVATCAMNHDTEIIDTVPAGYPLNNTTIKILDDDGRVCAAGDPGEIVVQNNFLCAGYWRDPDRTTSLFVDVPGAGKFCRTGDIARLRADGCVEYVGRKNLRVKIRGFRVELEEIERTLCTHASVLEAAVIVRREGNRDSQLAAYLVSRAGQPPSAEELRAHLQISLPPQMVPGSFEFLPSLPRTASGKIHRTALAELPTPVIATVNQPPCDAVEMGLTHLWEDLLERHPINVTDDFFALGGHSLLAARLSATIEQAFGVKLPLSTFLTAPTIEKQAELLRGQRRSMEWPLLVPINTRGSKPPLFCVHLADGNVLSYRDFARFLPSDQPLYGIQASGLDRTSRIYTRIEDMARAYVAEVRKFYPTGPYALCGWSYGGLIAFEMARQLQQQRQQVALLALFDTLAPRRLRRGRPVRHRRATLRYQLCRVPIHLRALLYGRNRLGYLREKIQTAKELVSVPLWRMFFAWERCGGWLPQLLRSVTHSNRIAERDYVPQRYDGHVTLFKASLPPGSGLHDLAAGWNNYVSGDLETHFVPGTHASMVFAPHARSLAQGITRCLDKVWARTKPGDDDKLACYRVIFVWLPTLAASI